MDTILVFGLHSYLLSDVTNVDLFYRRTAVLRPSNSVSLVQQEMLAKWKDYLCYPGVVTREELPGPKYHFEFKVSRVLRWFSHGQLA